MPDAEAKLYDTLQEDLAKLFESKKEGYLELVQDAYGDKPETVFTACRFIHNIYSAGNMSKKAFDKGWRDCKNYFADKDDLVNLAELEKLMDSLHLNIKDSEILTDWHKWQVLNDHPWGIMKTDIGTYEYMGVFGMTFQRGGFGSKEPVPTHFLDCDEHRKEELKNWDMKRLTAYIITRHYLAIKKEHQNDE